MKWRLCHYNFRTYFFSSFNKDWQIKSVNILCACFRGEIRFSLWDFSWCQRIPWKRSGICDCISFVNDSFCSFFIYRLTVFSDLRTALGAVVLEILTNNASFYVHKRSGLEALKCTVPFLEAKWKLWSVH